MTELVASHPFDNISVGALRRRRSLKWQRYPDDVLPAWVAEMDFPLAEVIRATLHEAVDAGDCGYGDPTQLAEAFASWAQGRWSWHIGNAEVKPVAQVVAGISEILKVASRPGDSVVIDTPVYPPFSWTIRSLGREVIEVPLAFRGGNYELDLLQIERAYSHGARAHILCSPHNPTGVVHSPDVLKAIAVLADRHNVLVLSDEIHAPLVLPGVQHTPFPLVSDVAARTGIVLTSASKGWNIAGLKAAMMVATSDETRSILGAIPDEVAYGVGHFGVLASRTAFSEGEAWLAGTIDLLDRNRRLMSNLLDALLPAAQYYPPQAGYLAWVDCRGLRLGDEPADVFLRHGRVAVTSGTPFGAAGTGFVRINMGTSRQLLTEIVERMATGAKLANSSL